MVRNASLSREAWTAAALRAMTERGVGGIAVEPLARTLGATKGSFYWHFTDRDDLIRSALERWEREETDAVIAALRPLDDGQARLRKVLEATFLTHPDVAAHTVALAADAEHPAVAAVLGRVTKRRIAYLAEQLEAVGLDAEEAQRRAVLVYTSCVGYFTLLRSAPDSAPQGTAARAFIDTMLRLLTC